ncbi:MAG: apolipoprotein N-acyltransferase [Betaproteobacteria bacterium]|nr:MAG: apolipoprotein N-acyltransferase [Betaproteobacteria bacterium]
MNPVAAGSGNPVVLGPAPAALAAFLLGAATVLGFAPFGLAPLPIFTAAGLLWLWQEASTPRRAAASGFAFGMGLFLAGVSWVYVSLHYYGAMPAPLAAIATLLFCALLALFPCATGYLQARLRVSIATRQLLLIPALWTLGEWLRDWVFTGFPWLAFGYSQAGSPLRAYAALTGVFGLSWLVWLCAGLLLALARARGRTAALAGLALVFGTGYGLKRIEWTQALGAPITVSLAQGNIPQELKWDSARFAATVQLYQRMIQGSAAQLTVLPETAIPRFLDLLDPELLRTLARTARSHGGDLIMGLPVRDASGRYYNSVLSLGLSPTQRYDKFHLVPFGEFIPPGFGWVLSILQIPLSDFSRGGGAQAPLALAGQKIAVNICYEDAFGEEIIRALPEATLLVNVSNVAWFGDSLAPHQHLQIAQLRALETGRSMLRATNTGMTAIIDHRGNIAASLPPFTQGALIGTAQGRSGATPYVRWGNAPVIALALLVWGLLMLRRRKAAAPV